VRAAKRIEEEDGPQGLEHLAAEPLSEV